MNVEDFEDIIYEKEETGICTATFSQHERRNEVTYISFLELYNVIEDMEKDKTLHFETYEEAAEWFDTHDMANYEDRLTPVDVELELR